MNKEASENSIIGVKQVNLTLKLVLTALFASLAIVLRLFKHAVIGPVQIVNLPAAICIIAALILGAYAGLSVGVISMTVSDLILGFGLWTFVTASFLGLIGLVFGIMKELINNKFQLFSMILIALFANDVLTSAILYMVLGFNPPLAFATGIIGLFLPAGGGYMFAVGPVTEISTSLLVVLTKPIIKKAFVEVL